MIKSMVTGDKVSAKVYAQEMLATAVRHTVELGVADEEMSDRELGKVTEQLEKISSRLLAKLGKPVEVDDAPEVCETEE